MTVRSVRMYAVVCDQCGDEQLLPAGSGPLAADSAVAAGWLRVADKNGELHYCSRECFVAAVSAPTTAPASAQE